MPAEPRRGTIIVLVVVMMLVLVAFASLTIDIGHVCAVKTNMQNVADAAALAGVAVMLDDDMLREHYDPVADILTEIHNTLEISARVGEEASLFAARNSRGEALSVCDGDILIGEITEPGNMNQRPDPTGSINAVEVTLRRSVDCNGPLQTFIARVVGIEEIDLEVSATAYRDDAYAGFSPPVGRSPLLPFTVHRDYYEQQIASGADDWHWHAASGPEPGGDTIREVWIFPSAAKTHDGIEDAGGGNFGTLAIGDGGLGTSQLSRQIEDGVSDADLLHDLGTDTLTFVGDDGTPASYTLDGNPGVSAGISSSIEGRVGDVVAFFIHDDVTNSGANADFNVIDIRYGILMEVALVGNPNLKRIVIQPTIYSGPGLVFDDGASGSGGLVSRLRLIR